jgi:hypothetical protein
MQPPLASIAKPNKLRALQQLNHTLRIPHTNLSVSINHEKSHDLEACPSIQTLRTSLQSKIDQRDSIDDATVTR